MLLTLLLVVLFNSESQGPESFSGRDVSHERPHSVVRYKFPQVFEFRRCQWFERLRWLHDADAVSRLRPLILLLWRYLLSSCGALDWNCSIKVRKFMCHW